MKTAQDLYKEETGQEALAYDYDQHAWYERAAYIAWLEGRVEASINEDLWKDS